MLSHRTAGRVAVVPTEATEEMCCAQAEWAAAANKWYAMLDAADPSPTADVDALVRALRECADDLETEVNARYPAETRAYPSMEVKYQRDMEPVLRARAALTKWETNDG